MEEVSMNSTALGAEKENINFISEAHEKFVTGKPPVPLQTKNKKKHPRVKRGVFNDRAKPMLLALRVQRVI